MNKDQYIKDSEHKSNPIFDPRDLFSKVGRDLCIVKEIVKGYLSDTAKNIQNLREALVSKDQNTVLRLAHTIKGASKYLGATEISEIALKFEKAAMSGELEEDHPLFIEFEGAYQKLKEAINKYEWDTL